MLLKSLSQLTVRRYALLWNWRIILPIVLSLGAMSLAASVFAARPNPSAESVDKDVRHVDCSSSNKSINSISAALASLDPSESNTIYVLGACSENVNIQGFDRLTLIAQNKASIADASRGAAAVVSITDSTRVTLKGFTINGSPNDQNDGIDCMFSNCYFSGNTVQGAADGVDVLQGARAFFDSDVIQNNNSRGINVATGAFALAKGVTVQMNAGHGVIVQTGGIFRINHCTVQNNAAMGILVRQNGTAILTQTTVTGNASDGIRVIDHSTLVVGALGDLIGNTITKNTNAGIRVKDLSFARFSDGVPNVVNGNLGGTDVLCLPQFPATRGVAVIAPGGGITNCMEP